ncbi:M12 family metallopeptidase [Granulosicoccus sp.]|nr:M12 family metallopeptidase [Granulosicoccus sp.]MDB4223590.1 M12 family metallopeptidase [Granulosicoccus sp.]
MLFKQNFRVSRRPVSTASFLIFTALSGCAKANDPEMFRADPNLLDDQTLNLPSTGSSGVFNYEIIQGIAVFEGDIILGKVDQNGALPLKLVPRGLGRSDAFGRWPDGIVPYFVPTNSSDLLQQRIAEAIAHWTEESNLSFVERNTSNQDLYPNFIRFESSNSCASYVGMQGGEQPVLVSDACSVGSIIHEVGHALGLFHEHTRPDRNNFAQINWDEIVAGKGINFEVLDAGVQEYGPYDYGSIMHYGEYFFSATGEPTIVVPDGISIGQRQSLSPLDVDSVNNMYSTDLVLFQPTLNAVDDGMEIGISVANQGQLGAQQLQLVANVSDDSQWQGISADSGWECTTVGTELRCDRPTLAEQKQSSFTLLVTSSSSNSEDVRLTLSSRTTDTDLSNNSFNDDASDVQSNDTPVQQLISAITEADQSVTVVPAIGSAKETQPAEIVEAPAAANTAAGGSDNGFLATLSGLALLWQRHRRITVVTDIGDADH